MAGCYWKSHAGWACVHIQKEWETNMREWETNQHDTVHRCIQYQLHMWANVAGSYQNGCAGARSGHRVDGRHSCTSGIWKAFPRSAVWCGEEDFPSAWRRPRTECSGMASHLRESEREEKKTFKTILHSSHLHITFVFFNLWITQHFFGFHKTVWPL